MAARLTMDKAVEKLRNVTDRFDILQLEACTRASVFYDRANDRTFSYVFHDLVKRLRENPEYIPRPTKALRAAKAPVVKSRRAATMQQRYGVQFSGQTDASRRQASETLRKVNSNPEYSAKRKQRLQDENVKSARLQTLRERYVGGHPQRDPAVRNKTRETCRVRYGTDSAWSNPQIRAKIAATNLARYGVAFAASSDAVKQRIRETNLERYGVPYPAQRDSHRHALTAAAQKFNGLTVNEWSQVTGVSSSYIHVLLRTGVCTNPADLSVRKTGIERAVAAALDALAVTYAYNNWVGGVGRPDFLLPDHNVVIECDGLYWHSDAFRDKNYHAKKRAAYIAAGYKPLFFRENEILEKKHIVESIIANALGKSKRIYARKCTVKELTKAEAKQFFSDNHLMGNGRGDTVALVCENVVVAAIQMVPHKEGAEVSRFCTLVGHAVIGGFSRLLKQAESRHPGKDVITFVDLRYGAGEHLTHMGFETRTAHPSFKWTRGNQVFNRMQYPGKTGYDHGLHKIWDCGQAKFVRKAA